MLAQDPRLIALLDVRVVHRLAGRLRLKVRALLWIPELSERITREISELNGVKTVRLTNVTGSILVLYEPDQCHEEALLEHIRAVFFQLQAYVARARRERLSPAVTQERKLHEESLGRKSLDVLITGATLAFVAMRRRGGGFAAPVSFLGRFTSLPAITALALAAPILKNGLRALAEDKRPNADALSATAIMASLAAGKDTSALMIIWLADIAELLTGYTMDRTRKAISQLLDVGDEFAWRVEKDGVEVKVPVAQLQPKDRIMVHTGEKICVDGRVVEGQTTVDQASITGEFLPLAKAAQDPVFAGTVVKSGTMIVEAERVGDNTAAARIIHLVEEASQKRAPIQMFADKFSARFIPINFALAAVVWMVTRDVQRALNMLIIDYSCGVRLSTATALAAAVSSAAKQGVLIKGGQYIETMASADTLILDKTGTLTAGKPKVADILPAHSQVNTNELIQMAAAAEQGAQHPLGVAIVEYAQQRSLAIPHHKAPETIVARGVRALVGQAEVVVGSSQLMQDVGIDTQVMQNQAARLVARGQHVLYVAVDTQLLGVIGIEDELRDDIKKSINRLRNLRMDEIILLTGDLEHAAEIMSNRLAMDGYQANVLPADKADEVLNHRIHGDRVIMVGDGINDGPALAHADVGVALGTNRTDLAVEAADIIIASDDALMLPATLKLSQKTMGIIQQNFATAIGVNTLGLVLSSAGLINPLWGAVLHNLTTVAVVGNSARLLWHRMLDR